MNKITLTCAIASLVGLFLIYYATLQLQPAQIKISDIDASLVGRSVTTSGYIVKKYNHPNGHVFLTISDGKARIQVPLFSGVVRSLIKSGISPDQLSINSKIVVSGVVDEYKDRLQIVPKKPEDVKILSG